MLTISPICAFNDNYIWLIEDTHKKLCVVVDPGDANPVLCTLESKQLRLCAILITHHHHDHTGGIAPLLNHDPVPIYGSTLTNNPLISHRLNEHDQVHLPELNLTLNVIATPGHTNDHIVYYNEQMLFCGDTLFSGGCGRLFEGSAQALYSSLQKLCQLNDNTQIYCAHEYTQQNLEFAQTIDPDNHTLQQRLEEVRSLRSKQQPTLPSTIKLEKLINPFLRCDRPEISLRLCDKPSEDPVKVFSTLRQLKDQW